MYSFSAVGRMGLTHFTETNFKITETDSTNNMIIWNPYFGVSCLSFVEKCQQNNVCKVIPCINQSIYKMYSHLISLLRCKSNHCGGLIRFIFCTFLTRKRSPQNLPIPGPMFEHHFNYRWYKIKFVWWYIKFVKWKLWFHLKC